MAYFCDMLSVFMMRDICLSLAFQAFKFCLQKNKTMTWKTKMRFFSQSKQFQQTEYRDNFCSRVSGGAIFFFISNNNFLPGVIILCYHIA